MIIAPPLCGQDTALPLGLPPVPDADLPLLRGQLFGALSWYPDRDHPGTELAECRLRVDCPFCQTVHTHGWQLSGHRRTERRLAHCGAGEYRVRPACISAIGGGHAYSPYRRLERPARRRRVVAVQWPSRPAYYPGGSTAWLAWRGSWIGEVLAENPGMPFWDALPIARQRACAALARMEVNR